MHNMHNTFADNIILVNIVFVCPPQPRGSTFPMLEGPSSQEGNVEEDQECVITPSTSVKFNAALKERNRVNYMRNYLLLIGILWCNMI